MATRESRATYNYCTESESVNSHTFLSCCLARDAVDDLLQLTRVATSVERRDCLSPASGREEKNSGVIYRKR